MEFGGDHDDTPRQRPYADGDDDFDHDFESGLYESGTLTGMDLAYVGEPVGPLLPDIAEQRPPVNESYLAELIDYLNVRMTLDIDDDQPDELPDRQDPATDVEIELALTAAAVLAGDIGEPNVLNVMVAAAALVMSVPVSAVTAVFMAMKLLSGTPH